MRAQIGKHTFEDHDEEDISIFDDTYQFVEIIGTDRPAAALAVLGGLTDALVDKVANALLNLDLLETVVDQEGYNWEELTVDSLTAARQLLAVVFGMEG